MKTYSNFYRDPLGQSEIEYRAANNDMVCGRVGPYLDAVRTLYPSVLYGEYAIHRKASSFQSNAYNTFASGSEDEGYIHIGGMGAGNRRFWSPFWIMNMGDVSGSAYPPYIRGLTADKSHINGTTGSPYSTGPFDIMLYDEAMWQESLDNVNSENIKNSVEYSGHFVDYATACKDDFLATKTAVQAVSPSCRIMPNFGDTAYVGLTDANTIAMLAATDIAMGENVARWTNGEPNLHSGICQARWDFMTSFTTSHDLFVRTYLNSPITQVDKDRAVLGSLAFFMMGYAPRIYGRHTDLPGESGAHVSTWEHNHLLRAMNTNFGTPKAAYFDAGGGYALGNLYIREFTKGRSYFFVRRPSSPGTTPTINLQLPIPMDRINPDGSFTLGVTTFTMTLGEGATFRDPTVPPVPIAPPRERTLGRVTRGGNTIKIRPRL